jgi:hypothetical protein
VAAEKDDDIGKVHEELRAQEESCDQLHTSLKTLNSLFNTLRDNQEGLRIVDVGGQRFCGRRGRGVVVVVIVWWVWCGVVVAAAVVADAGFGSALGRCVVGSSGRDKTATTTTLSHKHTHTHAHTHDAAPRGHI